MRCTISDIARQSGYAKSTVSAALNGKPGVNEKTREEILAIAAQNNYIPNDFARGLSMKNTSTLGIIIRDIANPFYAKMCRAIERKADESDFTTLIANTDGEKSKARKAIKLMISKMVSGVIIDISGNDWDVLDELKRSGMPFVLFGAGNENLMFSSVETDDAQGAYDAVSHLIENGHEKIGFIHGGAESVYSQRRLAGAAQAMQDHGLILRDDYIFRQAKTVAEGHAMGLRLIDMPDRPTAVLAYNDLAAIGIAQAVTERDLKIPDFISLVGFDDIDYCTIPLTTVAIPMDEMGEEAASMLLQAIAGKKQPKKVVMPSRLVVRRSVRKMTPEMPR